MKVLILDNFDSFTFNLYQYVGDILGADRKTSSAVEVIRNNDLTLSQIAKRKYDRIIISPGPGSPDQEQYFGVCREVILSLGKETPLFGICLGMQGIASCYGGRVIRAKLPMHGKTSRLSHDKRGVFHSLPQEMEVMRYHSLIVNRVDLPPELNISATAEDGEIMGLRHKEYPIEGVQFHPESFATEGGRTMIENFLKDKKT